MPQSHPPSPDLEFLRQENTRLRQDKQRLERQVERLQEEVHRLRRALEEALRAAQRQAAPFSRQCPKEHPRRPGRKAGPCYGRAHWRAIPEQIEETLEVPLPPQCPHCGGAVQRERVAEQFHTDLPPIQPRQVRFRVQIGHCRQCGRRLQGRHPRQTSDALGVAGSQLGPQAVAWAVVLVKRLGLSYDKAVAVLEQLCGLRISRSGLCQAIARAGQKAEPMYQELVAVVRRSARVTPDETGWKVGGRLWWAWVFATPEVTVYAIQPGRGFTEAAAVLGEGFAGLLVHDGWRSYGKFLTAGHQTCLAHLLRRCREMRLAGRGMAARFPGLIQTLLQQALALRDRRDAGQISTHGLAVARGRLQARLDRALWPVYRHPANERLAQHLYEQRLALFCFLDCPGVEATNWRAEQALRPLVVTRKVWGGNRTPAGAHTQEVLASLLRTCQQQHRSALAVLIELLCSPQPKVLDLVVWDRSPPTSRLPDPLPPSLAAA